VKILKNSYFKIGLISLGISLLILFVDYEHSISRGYKAFNILREIVKFIVVALGRDFAIFLFMALGLIFLVISLRKTYFN
jgi:hypothetical protein